MKLVVAAILLCVSSLSMNGQALQADVHDPNGVTADAALSSAYAFPNTAQGGSSSIVVRLTNTSSYPIQVNIVYVGTSNGSSTLSDSFTVTGLTLNKILAANGANAEDFTLSFTPPAVAGATGYLQATYQIQQNGCSFTSTDPTTQCASQTVTLSNLTGTGITAQWLLSLVNNGTSTRLQPSSSTPLSFGNVSTSGSTTYQFQIANTTSVPISTPAVSLVTQVFGSSAFKMDTSALPATLAAFGTGTFSVTFQPGQTGLTSATLTVGSLAYAIAGTGVVVADTDALTISYTDSTGVRTLPQAATPIDFGQLVSGGSASATLTFTVLNPSTSYNAITVPTLVATGVGFSLSALPTLPASIAPGASITFKAAFSPTQSGTYNGSLAIGGRAFSLTGKGIVSALPDVTMQVDTTPLLSNQQVHLTINLASASTVDAIGQLTMQFKPADADISDDASILFLATSGRNLQVNVAKGASAATYDGAAPITFQTGTTAGTITFTLTFADKAPLTQTFTITPAQIAITSASAVRQDPNLVITLTGFDNTYSAGPMTFTFYDTAGNAITATPMSVNATTNFHQYFFNNNTAGGAFSVQASFPVTGSVAQVGSVSVGLSNSSGTTSTKQNFK